jgi:hypothetical protein
MILTRYNVIPFLINAGLLPMRHVVDRAISVTASRQRNRVLRVRPSGENGFFVKQYRPDEGDWDAANHTTTLDVEAACYRAAGDDAHLSAAMPALHYYDAETRALVLELIEPDQTLSQHADARGIPLPLAQAWGETLARCQTGLGRQIRVGRLELPLPERVPWILQPGRLFTHADGDQSIAQGKVVSILQKHDSVRDALAAMAADWHTSGVIHGDMKWNNCLVQHDPDDDDAPPQLRIIDWEMADVGDIAWDVGGALHSWCFAAVLNIDMRAKAGADTTARVARDLERSLKKMRPSMRAFWQGYTGALEIGDLTIAAMRLRAVAAAGARLLQSAYEHMADETQLSREAVVSLQLGLDLITSPATGAALLLGEDA